ncbi:MAG: YqzL family protein [Clostridia bacterium]|nr:YqzL family protein [Clostridia bacterium]
MEELAWEMFCLTGNIDEYLLYKNAEIEGRSTENVSRPEKEAEREAGWSY